MLDTWKELRMAKMTANHSEPSAKYVNPKIQVKPKMQRREKEPKIEGIVTNFGNFSEKTSYLFFIFC
jgi:hypothetical protein